MSDFENVLVEPFARLLADIAPIEVVRQAETVVGLSPCWDALRESGYLDALVPEDRGGAGLTLKELHALAVVAGEKLLPAPFAETALARSLLAQNGQSAPEDASIVILAPSAAIPLAAHATHALLADGDDLLLRTIRRIAPDPFGAGGGLVEELGDTIARIPCGQVSLVHCGAALTSARMAGMMTKVLAMSIAFVGDRKQFGRPLSQFQAIQQQLAVMAEHVATASVAARIGMGGKGFEPARVAAAKSRVSEASVVVAGIAHAVHGAIGVTAEFDLNLYSRRLKQGQVAFGSENYWAAELARARLASTEDTSASFIRNTLAENDW